VIEPTCAITKYYIWNNNENNQPTTKMKSKIATMYLIRSKVSTKTERMNEVDIANTANNAKL